MRFLLLSIGATAFGVGLWTGLVRLGVPLSRDMPALAELHSALMICGFLGTLISLERAVAIGRWWAYAAPLFAAIGVSMLLTSAPWLASRVFLLASLALLGNSLVVAFRLPALFTAILCVAAGAWAAGTLAWILGYPAASSTGWWLAFLVLTIAAERLELSRLLAPPFSSQIMFAVAATLFLIGVARDEFRSEAALFSGLGLIASAIWLVRHDIALSMLRRQGQARFSAVALIFGYVWLGVAGFALLLVPPAASAFSYDAAVHAIAIGFVLSMVFGHAPSILPAVTGIRLRVNLAAYFPLVLLHLSVLLRIVADLCEWVDLRAISGPLTVLALASYAGVLVVASRSPKVASPPGNP